MPRIIQDWDQYFLRMAEVAASRSKDPRTQVGAVIVGPVYREIRATGYNGFPRLVEDKDPERWASGVKGLRVVHAEMNAILAAARTGASTEGCTLYCTLHPCIDCSKAICQAGITSVIVSREAMALYQSDWWTPEVQDHILGMFKEAGVLLSLR